MGASVPVLPRALWKNLVGTVIQYWPHGILKRVTSTGTRPNTVGQSRLNGPDLIVNVSQKEIGLQLKTIFPLLAESGV